jgi:predicted ATP-grasp superfamily ATP-dependent carboligase
VDHVTWSERLAFERPPLICAFQGWNDGGEAATTAARYLEERWGARAVGVLDPEEFYDFQVSRPTVRLEDGVSRVIEWPSCTFSAADVGGRGIVLFTAPEPNNRWRTFTESILGAARELDARLLVALGAFLTDVPHSRPVPVVGSAEDSETAARLGLARSQYEGPTGIVGVLHDASNRGGLPSVSLWAAVPHYLPAAPNPKAALALVQRASALLQIPVDTAPLAEASAAWEEGVSRLVRESEELSGYVDRLESAALQAEHDAASEASTPSEGIPLPGGRVPSGDAIAAEFERFLREQRGDGGGDG